MKKGLLPEAAASTAIVGNPKNQGPTLVGPCDFLDVVNAWTDLKTNPFVSYVYTSFTEHPKVAFCF
ncbi:hypothetical protein ACE1BH_21495 [Aeromonas jandaei]